tara:strand:+ start:475 stop:642 length:168 start_codon:yes stop_codon:yes gene_type:complete
MYGKKKSKKAGLMESLMKLKKGGRVKDEGVKKGKKSIAEMIGMKRKKKKSGMSGM